MHSRRWKNSKFFKKKGTTNNIFAHANVHLSMLSKYQKVRKSTFLTADLIQTRFPHAPTCLNLKNSFYITSISKKCHVIDHILSIALIEISIVISTASERGKRDFVAKTQDLNALTNYF